MDYSHFTLEVVWSNSWRQQSSNRVWNWCFEG